MEYRVYDAARDREAVHRIWYETGWLEPGKAEHEEAMEIFLGAGRGRSAWPTPRRGAYATLTRTSRSPALPRLLPAASPANRGSRKG